MLWDALGHSGMFQIAEHFVQRKRNEKEILFCVYQVNNTYADVVGLEILVL